MDNNLEMLIAEDMEEIASWIDELRIKTAAFGGFNKMDVYYQMQDLCARFRQVLETRLAEQSEAGGASPELAQQLEEKIEEVKRLEAQLEEKSEEIKRLQSGLGGAGDLERKLQEQSDESRREITDLKLQNHELLAKIDELNSQKLAAASQAPKYGDDLRSRELELELQRTRDELLRAKEQLAATPRNQYGDDLRIRELELDLQRAKEDLQRARELAAAPRPQYADELRLRELEMELQKTKEDLQRSRELVSVQRSQEESLTMGVAILDEARAEAARILEAARIKAEQETLKSMAVARQRAEHLESEVVTLTAKKKDLMLQIDSTEQRLQKAYLGIQGLIGILDSSSAPSEYSIRTKIPE